MAQQTPAKQLFELLVTKDFDPECLDAMGKPSPDPGETEVFSFDYTAESGNDYGTVVIMLADDNDMQVYFGDNLGKGMEGEDKKQWFDFLYSLKHFATKNLMSFSPKNLNRLRYSMQGQAAIKEGIFESWTGTRTTSWNGKATEARLMIKHKRALGENDARFRYVESLFIETAEGERYKLPFTKLSGGRAMVEHVRNGGRPYDARGQHITEMVTELNVLSRFRRANHGKIFEGDTKDLVEQTNAYYESAQKTLKSLSHGRGYKSYFESWNPDVITEEEAVVEGLKHLFVTQSLDSRIEDALPLLARIQQQGNAMKEANIFEAWIDNLAEGTWATPDTPEKQQQLIELLSKEFPVGPDATNATEQLYNLLGDDELFDQLEALAAEDADADCRQVIMDRMAMLSDQPEVQAVIDAVQIDPAATMNPAEPTDAGASAPPDEAQVPTMESDLEDVDSFGGDAADELIRDTETNQRGTDVNENDLASILRIAGVPAKERPAPDYELEENDDDSGSSIVPALAGGALGYAAGSGALDGIGSAVGDAIGGLISGGAADAGAAALGSMIEDEEETNEDELGTAIGAGLGGAVGGIPGAALGGIAGHYLTKDDDKQVKEETKELDRMSSLAGIKKKVADESLLAPLVGAVGGGLVGGEIAQGIGSKFGSEVGSAIGQAAGQEQAGTLGSVVGGIKGSSAGAVAGGEAAKKVGQVAGGIAGLAGGAAIDQVKKSNNEEETDEGWKGQLAGGTVGTLAGGALGTAIMPGVGTLIGSALGGTAGQMAGDKLGGNEETDEGYSTAGIAPAGGAPLESALQGQYGHSGKMKEVSKNANFLDRLKELSGMMRSDKI